MFHSMVLEENGLGDLGKMGITGKVGLHGRAQVEAMSLQALQYVSKLLVHRRITSVCDIESCSGGIRKREVDKYVSKYAACLYCDGKWKFC